MANFVEVRRLLDRLAELTERLSPAERRLVDDLAAKYEVPGGGDFDDKLCLEVILRNVEIRAGYGLAPERAGARRIDLGHRPPKKGGRN